jgi:hypothetical protein
MAPSVARVRPFSSRLWILGSIALGFVSGAMLAILVWIALMIALTPRTSTWFRHELVLFVGIAIVSLPALGQRWLLARSGIASGGYFTTTMLGGWLTWCVPILAFGRVDLVARLQRVDEIDIGIVLAGAALLFGGIVAGWLQGWAMPHPLRPLWFRTAPLAALVAAFGAAGVAFLFALATWDMPWVVRDPILGGLAVATGWGLFALVMDWPIRHALSLKSPAIEPAPVPARVPEPHAPAAAVPVPVLPVASAPDPVPAAATEAAAG